MPTKGYHLKNGSFVIILSSRTSYTNSMINLQFSLLLASNGVVGNKGKSDDV